MLKKMEMLPSANLGRGADFRLCEYFDYVAGTGTGAIIAADLALGMSAEELITFYRNNGRDMFEKSHLFQRLKIFYTADPLREQLTKVFGAKTDLSPEYLQC
jgi:patatin-like phospholipase/acyl hydrolase